MFHSHPRRTAKNELLECKQFVSKLVQILLRNRVEQNNPTSSQSDYPLRSRTKSDYIIPLKGILPHFRTHSDPGNGHIVNPVELRLGADDADFWIASTPMHFDIVCKLSGLLLERWILYFQPQSNKESVRVHSRDELEGPEASEENTTDLILLAQSLYSEIRGLPLGTTLGEKSLSKSELIYSLSMANGKAVDHNSSCISNHSFSAGRSFHPLAQLSVLKFRPAASSEGTLYLQVVYDSNLVALDAATLAPSYPTISTSKLYETAVESSIKEELGAIIGAGSFTIVTSPDIQTEPQEIPNRVSSSSPFPSPKMQRKVLSLSDRRNQTKNRTSSLQFNVSLDSSSDLDDDPIENHQLSADGTIIHKSVKDTIQKPKAVKKDHYSSDLYGTFVGSYEESIFVGRMSTTPSKPLPFLAEIGVLAIGKCNPRLKCPPHVSLSFSAYFYQLPDENFPTPYVGTIDMLEADDGHNLECSGYRIPNKGQLQIMIKNPSCTAIKVFLIPYDFRDMPRSTKTFIRQKSYATSKTGSSKDILKFAVHLNFHMTTKKHLYLTSHLRVVFSARPLETDQKLKIAYQTPTFPKFSDAIDQPAKASTDYSWLESDIPLENRGR